MSVPRQTLGTPGSTPGSPSNPTGSPHGSPSQADPPASYPISRYASGDQKTKSAFLVHRYSDKQIFQTHASFSTGSEFRLSAQEEEGARAGDIVITSAAAKRAAEVIHQAHQQHKIARVDLLSAVLGAWHDQLEARSAKLPHSKLWTFCRTLRGCARFHVMEADEALRAVEGVIGGLPKRHPSLWVDWLALPEDECGATEFMVTWARVDWGAGDSPLVAAARLADLDPPKLPDVRLTLRTPLYLRFLGMVHHLHQASGKPVPLPCRQVGKALGVGSITVSRLRQAAVMDGLLMMAKPHRMGTGGKKGDATEYAPVDPTKPPATTNYYDDPKA